MKLLITILFFFTATIAFGQLSIEANAGVNIGNTTSKHNGEKDKSSKPAIGYTIPVHINIPIAKSLLLQTGLEFESVHRKIKSTSYNESITGEITVSTIDGKAHMEYLNIPLKLFLQANKAMRVGVGPYIGIGLGGRNKGTLNYESQTMSSAPGIFYSITYDSKTKFGSDYNEIKRLNFGIGFNISYVFSNNLILGIYTNSGLTNISNYDGTTTKTTSIGLTAGYIFRNKASKKK